VGLNIKNRETYRLAQELSGLTGESLTATVTHALEEKLARVSRKKTPDQKLQAIRKIASEMASRFEEPYKSINHGDLLYDEFGLPK
jgi:antitoxin VapB